MSPKVVVQDIRDSRKEDGDSTDDADEIESILDSGDLDESIEVVESQSREYLGALNTDSSGECVELPSPITTSVKKSIVSKKMIVNGTDVKQSSCQGCSALRAELQQLKYDVKVKDAEMQEILECFNTSKASGDKLYQNLTDNIEKRISFHKKLMETEKKLRNVEATREKWEALYDIESGKVKDLELKCEGLEFQLKLEKNKKSQGPPIRAGNVEVPATKVKELMDMKNYHTKTCANTKKQHDLLQKELRESDRKLKIMHDNETDKQFEFIKMQKYYKSIIQHYVERDSEKSKCRKAVLKQASRCKDIGSKDQLLRDSSNFLNENQMAFLEGQLCGDVTFSVKDDLISSRYKELLLSIYQNSSNAYKILKSFNFNMPSISLVREYCQSELNTVQEQQYELLNEKQATMPLDQRTLRSLCPDEEDQEISDLLDASASQQVNLRGFVSRKQINSVLLMFFSHSDFVF